MSNAMKYIRDLEAVDFGRDQAEAQVQMVLDALEGDLVTKGDFATFQAQTKGDFAAFKTEIRSEFATFQSQMKGEFAAFQLQIQLQIKESEFRMTTRLGAIIVGTAAIGIPLLTWLIKT